MTIALFWGAVVTEKEPHTYPGAVLSECILSGFTISLSDKAKGSERTVLSVQPLHGEKTVLASLRLGQVETVKVDLRFRETVTFSVSGPNEVHLAGFITPTQDFRVPADALAMMDAEDDESEEEAEDDGAEESDELLPTDIHGADEDDDDDEDDEEEEEEEGEPETTNSIGPKSTDQQILQTPIGDLSVPKTDGASHPPQRRIDPDRCNWLNGHATGSLKYLLDLVQSEFMTEELLADALTVMEEVVQIANELKSEMLREEQVDSQVESQPCEPII
eukprot:GILJ01007313.1.p1 GENE.GILJ01007313.1~~GILJ01007313.1.p1  ORF type:complete len:292 (-),score=60.01 GILJ01007313.1:45-872(-)